MKPINGYEDRYCVDESGRVFSLVGGSVKEIKAVLTSDGYHRVGLYAQDGSRRMLAVHRLVAGTFIPPIPGKNLVNHINGVKTDNTLSNLEWVDHSGNMRHSVATGLHRSPPSLCHLAPRVLELRKQSYSFTKIAQVLGIAVSTAHRLSRGTESDGAVHEHQ